MAQWVAEDAETVTPCCCVRPHGHLTIRLVESDYLEGSPEVQHSPLVVGMTFSNDMYERFRQNSSHPFAMSACTTLIWPRAKAPNSTNNDSAYVVDGLTAAALGAGRILQLQFLLYNRTPVFQLALADSQAPAYISYGSETTAIENLQLSAAYRDCLTDKHQGCAALLPYMSQIVTCNPSWRFVQPTHYIQS
ncbi:hypothetical protein T265_11883 [Opisthorchis viverrini]|uniref:Uncharacterized protein n=1 Tax=Opisthorchis viverrini TaxID=6198 RepID=A0A074ZVU1_OPIVI|nr:hypothetical protein T265_11883 [Opisthorchis viverrini]KER19294.1 hypothetical protein T265_11883 [Opisthorchis viverrini]